MVDMSKKSAVSKRLDKPINPADMAFAKFMVKLYTSDRLAFYFKLKALLKNRFSLMDALERMYQIYSKDGKKPTESMAVAITVWMKQIRNGDTFSVALDGWAPPTEILMLSVGDVSNLEMALENTIKVVEGVRRMKEPVISAVSYPLFLLFMVVLLIYGVGAFMVPPMINAVPNLIWTGTAKSLVDLSSFVQEHPWPLFLTLPIIVVLVLFTFPRWKAESRSVADKFPPWSIYRIFIGVGWLLSLSALVNAGTPVSKAMRSLRAFANPYLLFRIDKALAYVNNGDNLGDSLYKTKLGFPDEEVVGDLRIYSELDNFPEALSRLSEDWLETSVKDVEKKASVLNSFAILLIAVVVAWVVMGTFDMQEQMVNGMGLGGGR
ncbi:MAG: type II secretion system F family protein [Alphaproteobacteria bacterium]|nr:type II secretion system F family protein [Alphaproteobacteria bacterium]